jgi:hypothetical protein
MRQPTAGIGETAMPHEDVGVATPTGHGLAFELIVAAILAAVFALLFAPLGEWVLKKRKMLALRVRLWTHLRGRSLRVSCSALLSIGSGSGYILARMLRRRDALGPFGGVHKSSLAASAELYELGFVPQSISHPSAHAIAGDLRGFLPSEKLPDFLAWFHEGIHRESDSECLRREVREELHEIGLPDLAPDVDHLEFRFVREVLEGPYFIQGDERWQVRIFRIYELDTDSLRSRQFRERLLDHTNTTENLSLASRTEIRVGRVRGHAIGHHAGYLLGQRRIRPDLPSFDC